MNDLEIEYCRMNGCEKLKGILIDTTGMDSDEFFIPDVNKEGYYTETEKWCGEEGDEGVYDDDEIIGNIEDHAELSFEEWRKRRNKVNQALDKFDEGEK